MKWLGAVSLFRALAIALVFGGPLPRVAADVVPLKTLVCKYSIRAIALSPDGTMLAAGEEPPARAAAIHVWHFPSCRPALTLHGHKHVVSGLAFHPSKPVLVSTSFDEMLTCWDPRKGSKLASVRTDTVSGDTNPYEARGHESQQQDATSDHPAFFHRKLPQLQVKGPSGERMLPLAAIWRPRGRPAVGVP
jgi:hypothetical protein